MAGADEGGGGSRRKGHGPAYFLIMIAIVVGLILVALHVLHRIGNAIP